MQTLIWNKIKNLDDKTTRMEEELPTIGGSIIEITLQSNRGTPISGIAVTLSGENKSYTAISNEQGKCLFFGIRQIGNFIATADNPEYQEFTFTIDYYGSYSFTLSDGAVLDIKIWCEKAGLNYSTLDEIPEVDIRKLMTVHAAVDYLVENIQEYSADDARELLNNDICAKWINLRDYALDMLYTNPVAKSIMDSLGKYGYGEWALLPQVPKMTSNTAPYGEVFADSISESRFDKYMAFDENTGTRWSADGTHTYEGQFIGYKFTKKTKVNGVYIDWFEDTSAKAIRGNDAIVQASDDNVNWVDIAVCELGLTYSGTGHCAKNWRFENDKSFLYWRIKPASAEGFAGWTCWKLQFYAWGAKGAVPVMTSNTAPYGKVEVGSDNNPSDKNSTGGYPIFDGDDSSYGATGGYNSSYLGWASYEFVNPIRVKRFSVINGVWNSTYRCKTFKIQALDNDLWVDLTDNIILPNDSNEYFYDVSKNLGYYKKYRIYIIDSYAAESVSTGVNKLQFYGRQLNVSVPVMTSNTAPWGEAIGSGISSSSHPYWHAFDWDNSTFAQASGLDGYNNQRIGYNFKHPVDIKIVKYRGFDHLTFKFQYSDDGINWEDASVLFTGWIDSDNIDHYYSLNNVGAHKYWAILSPTNDGVAVLYTLDFYGVDYSEREFEEGSTMKYIYDHGVELEELDYTVLVHSSSSGYIEKEENAIHFNKSDGGTGIACFMVNNKTTDLAQSSLIRLTANYSDSFEIVIYSTKPTAWGDTVKNQIGYCKNTTPTYAYLDVSNINAEGYLMIGVNSEIANTVYADIYELWLE